MFISVSPQKCSTCKNKDTANWTFKNPFSGMAPLGLGYAASSLKNAAMESFKAARAFESQVAWANGLARSSAEVYDDFIDAAKVVNDQIINRVDPGSPGKDSTWIETGVLKKTPPLYGEGYYTFGGRRDRIYTYPLNQVWVDEEEGEEMKLDTKPTEQQIKNVDLAIEVWEELAITGGEKIDLPNHIKEKVHHFNHMCPLCPAFVGCEKCPLIKCGTGSLYGRWCGAPNETKKSEAAQAIVDTLKKWKEVHCSTKKKSERIQEQIDRLTKDLEDAKKKELKLNELYLRVNKFNHLCIEFNHSFIGHITPKGECHMINNLAFAKTYEKWRESGMHVSTETVRWQNGTYGINEDFELKRLDLGSIIYDFDFCMTESGCADPNIIKLKCKNKPILF